MHEKMWIVRCIISLSIIFNLQLAECTIDDHKTCDAHPTCDLIGENEDRIWSEKDNVKKISNATNVLTNSHEHFNDSESDLLRVIGEKFLNRALPFQHSSDHSDVCKTQWQIYSNALEHLDLWALQMYDANAKLPSGLLNGNINQFGDFDQCLMVRGPTEDLVGKYCLAYVQISISDKWPRLYHLRKLIQSHDAFVSEFDDPGHRVPRFSLINWAVCVPSGCSHIDVQNSLNAFMKNATTATGIEYQLRVEEKMCQIKEPIKFNDLHTRLAVYFFLSITLIAIISTAIELFIDNPYEPLTAFSLLKNAKSLLSMKRETGDISTLHGIRFVNAFLLLMSHKSMAMFFNPYANRTEMIEVLGDHVSVLGRAAAIYTDAFLLMSGLLTTYSIIGRLQRQQSPRIFQEYIGRLLRIVPTFGALILFCTYILPNMGSGPQWNLVVNKHAEICKETWWRNLLFIHNYFGFDKMCLTHTHHLGIDTELFAMAPPLIILLWRYPRNTGIFLFILATMSTVGRFYITVIEKLSNYVYFGTSISQLFRTADKMYSIPFYRATIYVAGIAVGYILRVHKNSRLTKNQMRWGWYVSVVLFLVALFGPARMGNINYKYNEYHAAIYAAFGPMAWCSLFVWIIFTSHNGYSNFLSRILSWEGFLITTRLSYAIYLTQFPIFFYNVGQVRYPGHYHFISSTGNIFEIAWIVLISAILTLFFDIPFQNIKKCIFKKPILYDKKLSAENIVKNR